MAEAEGIPKLEIRPGDRVCLVGEDPFRQDSHSVLRLDGGTGVFIRDSAQNERFVRFDEIQLAFRPISKRK